MSKLKHVLVVLTVAAISSAAGFWLDQHPPRVTIINPARPPVPILEPAEVEKIRTLQNTKEVFLLGGISPDAILTRDDCRMHYRSARIGNDGARQREKRSPGEIDVGTT